MVAGQWFHGCSACGKCCNSAPAASVPELLHHQARFIGCLSIRRMPRLRVGQPLGPRRATEQDVAAARELSASLFFPGPPGTEHDVFLFTQAFDYGASCPALDPSGRCQVYEDRKPTVCGAVPLEATWPDRLQDAVLTARHQEAAYLGADCITPKRATLPLVVDGPQIVDTAARAALARRRAELVDERRFWGERVARLLGPQLLTQPARLRDIPEDGALTLSMVPVIAALAETSPRCHARATEYVAAQSELLEHTLGETSLAPSDVAQLRAFLASNRALSRQLTRGPLPRSPVQPELARDLERWLSLG